MEKQLETDKVPRNYQQFELNFFTGWSKWNWNYFTLQKAGSENTRFDEPQISAQTWISRLEKNHSGFYRGIPGKYPAMFCFGLSSFLLRRDLDTLYFVQLSIFPKKFNEKNILVKGQLNFKMSFWRHCLDQNTNEKIWQILAWKLKSGQIIR